MAADDPRRALPSVDALMQAPELQELVAAAGRDVVLRHARAVLERARRGETGPPDRLAAQAADAVRAASEPSLRPVLNATGVVVHTNLGRAPLSPAAIARVAEVASGYTNLELDLATGSRGRRDTHAEARLLGLTGAEAALVVNNNAAALLLAVNALAEGREVVVSRGELVEIGGSFRIPDVLRKAGARLVEVGTTNRTRVADYRAAVGPDTALLLKVHPSNFRVVGFTEEASREQLVALGRDQGIPVVEDLGSGVLTPLAAPLHQEPSVGQALGAGMDLVLFSGDKLLGGPQAGLALGSRAVVDTLRRNPLYRCLRVDKMVMAALDATLASYERGLEQREVPVRRMLALSAADLRPRVEALARALEAALPVRVLDGASAVGGGAAPDVLLPTVLLALRHPRLGADALAAALRAAAVPVLARIVDDEVVLDLRTVPPEDDRTLADLVLTLRT